MKTFHYILLIGLVMTLTFCKKTVDPIQPPTPIGQANVPPGFDWRTAHPVMFHITGASGQFIEITTADGNTTMHKCGIQPGATTTDVIITIPDFMKEVKVNGIPVTISGTDVYVTVPMMKDMLLTNYTLVFDGADDYVDLGDVTELNNVATFTIEGWAKQTLNTAAENIFSKVFDGDNDIRVRTAGGDLYVEVGNGSDSYGAWTSYSSTITSGTWFHWAVVYDGGGGSDAARLKLYIDGVATPITLTFTGTIPATTSSSLSTNNAYFSSGADFFDGSMDEVRIWDVARSGANINSYYNKIISGATANLVASWRMDEGTGITAGDETSNSYDATISGCTWVLYSNSWDSDGDGSLI